MLEALPREIRLEIWRYVYSGCRYDIWYERLWVTPSQGRLSRRNGLQPAETRQEYRTDTFKTCAQLVVQRHNVVEPERDLCERWHKCTVATCARARGRELLLPGLCRAFHPELVEALFTHAIFNVSGDAIAAFVDRLTPLQHRRIRTIRTQLQAWVQNGGGIQWATNRGSLEGVEGDELVHAFQSCCFPPRATLEIWIGLNDSTNGFRWLWGPQPTSYYRELLKAAVRDLAALKGERVAGFATPTTESGPVTIGYTADLEEAQPRSSRD